MKVLFTSPRSSRMSSTLHSMIPEDVQIIVSKKGTEEELIQLASDVDIIVCVTLSKEVAQAARNLKLVQKTGAGVDAIPFDVLKNDVYVAYTSGANPVPLAEGTVALILALAKNIVHKHNNFPHRDNMRRSVGLLGKNAGIIGLGHIGVEVARLLKAFEMNIFLASFISLILIIFSFTRFF